MEQAQLAATEKAFVPSAGGLPGAPPPLTHETGGYPQSGAVRSATMNPSGEENQVESDRKKRAYTSLFASNVSLSYRREASAAEDKPAPTSPTLLSGASAGNSLPLS